MNQNPPSFAGDSTTRADLNGISNLRLQRDRLPSDKIGQAETLQETLHYRRGSSTKVLSVSECDRTPPSPKAVSRPQQNLFKRINVSSSVLSNNLRRRTHQYWQLLLKFTKFIGPGFLVAVAYIDPGNYATDVSAGASTKFKLLFVVFMSNVFAIILQTLAVRLGSITGMDLAQNCRAHLPTWLNIILYVMAEAAIIATDIAEVRTMRHSTKQKYLSLYYLKFYFVHLR